MLPIVALLWQLWCWGHPATDPGGPQRPIVTEVVESEDVCRELLGDQGEVRHWSEVYGAPPADGSPDQKLGCWCEPRRDC